MFQSIINQNCTTNLNDRHYESFISSSSSSPLHHLDFEKYTSMLLFDDYTMSFLPVIAYIGILLYVLYFILIQGGKMILRVVSLSSLLGTPQQRVVPEVVTTNNKKYSPLSSSSLSTMTNSSTLFLSSEEGSTKTSKKKILLWIFFIIIFNDFISSLTAVMDDNNNTVSTFFINNNNDVMSSSNSKIGGGLKQLLKGTDPMLNEILKRVPSIEKGPSAPLLFGNRHLQFVPWLIQNEIHRREEIPFQRISIEVTGCEDKTSSREDGFPFLDHNTCVPSSRMNDIITIDVFPPFDDDDDNNITNNNEDSASSSSILSSKFNRTSPIIFFMPGLRCYSQDMPGNMIIRRAYADGFRSIVVNRRGHTPGMKLKAPRWNLFGDVEDLEQIYWYVREELVGGSDEGITTPFFLHGISSGTSVVVSALSKWDYQREHHHRDDYSYARRRNGITSFVDNNNNNNTKIPSFVASVLITPGYDTSKVLLPKGFRFPYNDILTPMVKQSFVKQNEKILRDFNSDAVDATLRATTLQEFVDAAAPFAGYTNSSEYYRHTNPTNNLHYITTPTFVLNSIDDPCCDIGNLYEPSIRHGNKTYAQIVEESQRVIVAVTKTGSHCPFLQGDSPFSLLPSFIRDPLHTNKRRYMLNSWADEVSIDYYKAALEVYGDSPRFL